MPSVPPVVKADLSGKTVAVIGANTGIGLEAAKHFARMNPARLICTCRSLVKANVTVSSIKKDTGCTTAEPWVVELSDFKSVVAFAERLEKEGVLLDIFVYNAAVALTRHELTKDGWETQLQVNHLSAALLSLLLLPNLLHSAEMSGGLSRIVIVSSEVHAWTEFSKAKLTNGILETLNKEDSFDNSNRYAESKLLNVLFTRGLAGHLPPDAPLIVDTVNPGFCLSDLRRHIEDHGQFDQWMANAKTSEEGARDLILAALGPEDASNDELRKLHGGYVSDAKLVEPSEWVRSQEGQEQQEAVWEETVDVVRGIAPMTGVIVKKYASQ